MDGGKVALIAASAPLPLLAVLLLTPLGTLELISEPIHEAFIALAVLVAATLGILAIHAFLTRGKVRDLGLASALLGFCAIYSWHGILTGVHPDFEWLIYGPASRVVFGAALLAVASTATIKGRRRPVIAATVLLVAGALAFAGWVLAPGVGSWALEQEEVTIEGTRLAIEITALVLASAATWRLLAGPTHSAPVPVVAGAVLIVQQSLYFLLSTPWSTIWWAAHTLGAIGMTVLAAGILRVVRRAHIEAHVEWLRRETDVRQTFLNNAAHALRTPMTPLALQLHILHEKLQDEELRRHVEKAQHSTKRLSGIVDELLLAAEAGATKSAYSKAKTIDLAILADDIAADLEGDANAKGLQLLVDAKTARVYGDETRLRKVIQNLLDNAIRYTPAGHVIITTRRTRDGSVVKVEDTGIGMSDEDLELLFTPFNRPGSAKQQSTKGSGLSLAICRMIIASHGGTIRATSRGAGKGTKVTFTVPRGGVP